MEPTYVGCYLFKGLLAVVVGLGSLVPGHFRPEPGHVLLLGDEKLPGSRGLGGWYAACLEFGMLTVDTDQQRVLYPLRFPFRCGKQACPFILRWNAAGR